MSVKHKDKQILVVSLYVDDLLMTGNYTWLILATSLFIIMGGILGIVARLLMTGNICVIRLITLAGVFPFILLPLQAAGAGSLWRSISAINCHVSLPLGCSITKGGLYQVLHLLQPEGRRALILIVTMPAGPFSQGVSWRGMDFQLHCLRPREVPYHSGS